MGSLSQKLGSKAILICGRSAAQETGSLSKVLELLRASSIEVAIYDQIISNPSSDRIDEAIALAKRHHSEFVIGLGGGSALDAAKAVALLPTGSIRDLIGKTLPSSNYALPLIAIPTLFGSGSEVTKSAIIRDPILRFKSGIRGEVLFPKIALVDSELICSVPMQILRESMFDALTHAIETLVSRKNNPISQMISEKALELISGLLPKLIIGERSPAIDDALGLVSLLGGINVANCGTCFPHRLEQAMASLYRTPVSHGQGLAIVYKSWLLHAYPYAKDRFDRISNFFPGKNIHQAIGEIIGQLSLNCGLKDVGFNQNDIPQIIGNISGATTNDPIEGNYTEWFNKILIESL
ncbi:MAG: iron-containing alcohol dehydrogenase [Verrucomicrobia bacterium]|nr:iron-containing alcohol dehydrogenase [Verrucomicrobiota bacterium]MBU6446099.1 iron-containing alcohol dehydrogenase [Verrucomicrobiota bacterium]